MTTPNMKKEYRKELRELSGKAKLLDKNLANFKKECEREFTLLLKKYSLENRKIVRREALAEKATAKATVKIERRIAILEGRLS